jgi:hypothetical protein
MKMSDLWNVASCSLVEIDWRFRSAHCFQHQGDDSSSVSVSTTVHGATFQKTVIFILAAVRTWNLTKTDHVGRTPAAIFCSEVWSALRARPQWEVPSWKRLRLSPCLLFLIAKWKKSFIHLQACSRHAPIGRFICKVCHLKRNSATITHYDTKVKSEIGILSCNRLFQRPRHF